MLRRTACVLVLISVIGLLTAPAHAHLTPPRCQGKFAPNEAVCYVGHQYQDHKRYIRVECEDHDCLDSVDDLRRWAVRTVLCMVLEQPPADWPKCVDAPPTP